MRYDFIEIGTSDFDTLLQSTKNLIGLSIEPIKFYLDRLPKNDHVIKVNCAVSDRNGFTDVLWVDPLDIDYYGLPIYLKGCNSIIKTHPTTDKILKENNLEFLLKRTECEMVTWDKLIQRYDIDSVDLLKIDTEGHDCFIINNILDSEKKVLPKRLWFESNELSNSKLIERTLERLYNNNYTLTEQGEWDIKLERK